MDRYITIEGVKVDLKRVYKTQIEQYNGKYYLWINNHCKWQCDTLEEATKASDEIVSKAREYLKSIGEAPIQT